MVNRIYTYRISLFFYGKPKEERTCKMCGAVVKSKLRLHVIQRHRDVIDQYAKHGLVRVKPLSPSQMKARHIDPQEARYHEHG